jgi:hypothetical protein
LAASGRVRSTVRNLDDFLIRPTRATE